MLNKELFMVVIPAVSWLLFALGGTQISDSVKGWKGWRRFILPAVYIAGCFIAGIVWWKAALVGAIAGVYSLGYGDGKMWWQRALIGLTYSFITIPIGISTWNAITALGFFVLFYASNARITANIFIWKICEGLFGLLCGIQLAYLLIGHGLIW